MQPSFKQLTNFLLELGTEQVRHTKKSYLAHVIGVYNYLDRLARRPFDCHPLEFLGRFGR